MIGAGGFSGTEVAAAVAGGLTIGLFAGLTYKLIKSSEVVPVKDPWARAREKSLRIAEEFVRSLDDADAITKELTRPLSPDTIIYRYGGANPSNLTPKQKDKYTGLSFSTVPLPGSAMTTINALNATGYVYAVYDGGTHVSVKPYGGTIEDWINAGPSSVWTQAVRSVVFKLNIG